MELPSILINQIKEKNVVLFLGSGASVGSIHPDGKMIPTGKELSRSIAQKFLGGGFEDRSLAEIGELAVSETDLFTVQEFIASLYYEFQPASFHKIIPTFAWAAIVTTNYDLIIERAYDQVRDRLQTPVPFKKNTEKIEE